MSRLLLLLVALVITACSSQRDGEVAQAADGFYAALASGDGARACALLSPRAEEGLEKGGDTCPEVVLDLDLRGGAPLGGPRVYGDEAQVRLAADTVFLHRFADGWRVRAAGCEPRPGLPYRCEIEG
ncbi:hypothetical protein [Nonomuraea endophytica]|uniref:Lipoprotein n=1 Tax=Nonomuraea endophytica TaxID=714136 RepID=A0A7W8EF68_9ACTN|nr:hypothetical protein [Nonomuraea endophytica]MBB5076152.1 hypothetical protein [Nonomuraea endophytica]